MPHISELTYNIQLTRAGPSKAKRRKLAIEDIEKLIGQKGIWKWFSFPIYIPTEWLEGWQQTLITTLEKKDDKLFELLKESRKNERVPQNTNSL